MNLDEIRARYATGIFGVMGRHPLRDWLFAELARDGVDTTRIFNPQVARGKWKPEDQVIEDGVKASGLPLLYILGSPSEPDRTAYSGYAVWQAIASLFNPHVTTRLFFDPAGLDPKTAKSYKKIINDLTARWPDAVLSSWEEFLGAAISSYDADPHMQAVLLGTGGTNPWPTNFLRIIEDRVDRTKFHNTLLGRGMWNKSLQLMEDQLIAAATHHFYFIGDPGEQRDPTEQVPAYSIMETAVGLRESSPGSIAVYFDLQGTTGHGNDVLAKVLIDVRRDFPDAPVFVDDPDAAKAWLAAQL